MAWIHTTMWGCVPTSSRLLGSSFSLCFFLSQLPPLCLSPCPFSFPSLQAQLLIRQ